MKKLLSILIFAMSCAVVHAGSTDLILPVGPGGLLHKYAIELQPILSKITGAVVVLDFKPGARGLVGAKALASSRSKNVLMLGVPQKWDDISEGAMSQITDITPVAFMGTAPGVIVARPNTAYSNMVEFLVYNTSKKISYGLPAGSTNAPLLRRIMIPYDSVEVPYKSGGPAIIDVAGGYVDLGVTVTDVALSYIQAGRLTALAVFGPERSNLLPNVTTLREQGIETASDLKSYNNIFLWAGRDVDQELVAHIQKELTAYMRSNEGREMLARIDIKFGKAHLNEPAAMLKRLLADD